MHTQLRIQTPKCWQVGHICMADLNIGGSKINVYDHLVYFIYFYLNASHRLVGTVPRWPVSCHGLIDALKNACKSLFKWQACNIAFWSFRQKVLGGFSDSGPNATAK